MVSPSGRTNLLQVDRALLDQRLRIAIPIRVASVASCSDSGSGLSLRTQSVKWIVLAHERVLEALVERRRGFRADAVRVGDLDAVQARVAADRQAARRCR